MYRYGKMDEITRNCLKWKLNSAARCSAVGMRLASSRIYSVGTSQTLQLSDINRLYVLNILAKMSVLQFLQRCL